MLKIGIFLLMGKKYLNLKPIIKMLTFQLNCVSEVCEFSVDCKSIDKSGIMNIHKYLMTKNNIKQCLACLLNY